MAAASRLFYVQVEVRLMQIDEDGSGRSESFQVDRTAHVLHHYPDAGEAQREFVSFNEILAHARALAERRRR